MQQVSAGPAWAQVAFYTAGLGFLALAKAKNVLTGYSTPKPFAIDETDRCIDYAVGLGEKYIRFLRLRGIDITGRRILELGPGSDLGVGLHLIRQGAGGYVGFDRNNLAGRVPDSFYARMAGRGLADPEALRDGRVAYAVDGNFDVGTVTGRFDIVVSNAAFEHFDDVERTVRQLRHVMRPGGVAVISVDLQTHSRWIRERDPNNIYRYPEALYRLFSFPGQPNRLRPWAYRAFFERHGWQDVALTPHDRVEPALAARLARPFRDDEQADWLSFTLFARKAAGA